MEPQQPQSDPNSANSNPGPTSPEPAQLSMQSPAASSTLAMPLAAETTVPSSWPGAFGIYKTSKAAVLLNLSTIIGLGLATFAVNVLMSMFFREDIKFVGDIISFLVSTLFSVGTILAYIAGVRGQKIGISDSLSKSMPLWLGMIGLSILTGLILAFSLLLLIVPFFFVFPRVALAPYYLIDQKLDIIEALKASWVRTKGHVSKVYGIIGASLAMLLLCLTIVGIPFAIYFLIMYSAATAVLYEFVQKQNTTTP